MEYFHGAAVHRTKYRWGLCLGKHIYVNENASNFVIWHEFGHYIQWLYLGWLYYVVVALPSIIHAGIYVLLGRRWDYYKFYTEAWANKLASQFLGYDIMSKTL